MDVSDTLLIQITLLNSIYLLFQTLANSTWFMIWTGMGCLLEASLCSGWYNFNRNLYQFSDKFLFNEIICSMGGYNTSELNTMNLIVSPIVWKHFLIFITHRLDYQHLVWQDNLKHSRLEPKNIGSFEKCDVLIPISLHWDTNFVLEYWHFWQELLICLTIPNQSTFH